MGFTELLKNGNGKSNDMEGWDITVGEYSGWTVLNDGYNGNRAFVTSTELCRKCQMVDLYSAGLTKEYISKNIPKIIPSVWVRASRPINCSPENCYVNVQLRDEDMNTLAEWDTGMLQLNEKWRELKYIFTNYNGNVRYVYWEDGNNEDFVSYQDRETYFSCLSLRIAFDKPANSTPAASLVTSEEIASSFVHQSEQVSEKVMAIINNGQEFIDPEFTFTSTEDMEPRRCRDLFDETPELYKEGSSGKDIADPDTVTSNYFFALKSIAGQSYFVKKIFLTDKFNEAGIYELLIYKRGFPYRIVVDEYVYCHPDSKYIYYARNKGSELWAPLIEKAYAKMYGSYESLCQFEISTAFEDLTGCPTLTHNLCSTSVKERVKSGSFFEEVQKYVKLGYMISVLSNPDDDGDYRTAQGIFIDHKYSLIAAEQVGTLQLVRLLDTWSEDGWKGPYSDNDTERWTDDLKAAVGYVNADDGYFWMSFDDFMKNFRLLIVAITDKYLHCFRVPVKYNKRNDAISYYVTISEPETTIYLSIYQEDERLSGAKPFIRAGAFLVLVTDGQAKSLLCTLHVPTGTNTGVTTVGPGNYVVLPYVHYTEENKCIEYKDSVCLSIHCTKPFTVQREKIPFFFARTATYEWLMRNEP